MKIVIAGGSGLIGQRLVSKWVSVGHNVVVLSRSTKTTFNSAQVKVAVWDPEKWQIPIPDLEGCDAIVNLAGTDISEKKWDKKQKGLIKDSRLFSTRCLLKACEKLQVKPKVFVNASAIGYYGDTKDNTCVEDTPPGTGFLAEVCKDWEREAMRAQDYGIRTVIVRIGIVLSSDGGALKKMLPSFKIGLGGKFGNGKQWMSWIHIDDTVKLIDWLINRDRLSGIFNAVSPNPVTNKEFTSILGKSLKRPSLIPVPAFLLRHLLGEMAELVLTGQKVLPQKSMRFGFQFSYPDLRAALDSLFTAS